MDERYNLTTASYQDRGFVRNAGGMWDSKNKTWYITKDQFEKYGEVERFKTILQTLPFPFKSIEPENRYINDSNNPPKVSIQFYDNLNNLENINCFSNEEDKWRNSMIEFENKYKLNIELSGKFITERGRINCSLRENNGFYRWLGIQFVIANL